MWMNGLRLLWPVVVMVVVVAVVPFCPAPPCCESTQPCPHTRHAHLKKIRQLLNALVRQQPSLLERTLAPLVLLPQCRGCLDFDNKKAYFRAQVNQKYQ
jgi:hypothetical protein